MDTALGEDLGDLLDGLIGRHLRAAAPLTHGRVVLPRHARDIRVLEACAFHERRQSVTKRFGVAHGSMAGEQTSA